MSFCFTMARKTIYKAIRLCFALTFFFVPVKAQFTINWIGGTGDWDNPNNWDTGVVPTFSDAPLIPASDNDTIYIKPGISAEAGFFKIETGNVLFLVDETSTLTILDKRIHNQGVIINNGRIQVDANNASLIFSLGNDGGKIENIGKIIINNSGDKGIQNYQGSTFINHNEALIDINQSGRESISNQGSFVNDGMIEAYHSGSFGSVVNRSYYDFITDTFYVATYVNTGEINIVGAEGSFAYGISNSGKFSNQGGTISIDSTEWDGIHNSKANLDYEAEFNNSGTILIKSGVATEPFRSGIFNFFEARYINEENGIITIDSLSYPNINPEKHGIKNEVRGYFMNKGLIEMNNIKNSLENKAEFINEGQIISRNTFGNHFNNTSNEAVFKNSGLIIAERSIISFSALANGSGALFENNGEFKAFARGSSSFAAISNFNEGTIKNSNFIYTDHGLTNQGTFINESGIIEIDSFNLSNEGEFAEFINRGKILLKKHFAYINNDGGANFVNEDSLIVSDIPSGFLGIIRNTDPNTNFTNSGLIEISNTGYASALSDGFGAGILVDDSATFKNEQNIIIEATSGPGISVNLNGFFSNSGLIDLLPGRRPTGIRTIGKSFRNLSGGLINISEVEFTGIMLGGDSNFSNEADAVININSGGAYDWPNEIGAGIFFYGGELDNNGTIHLTDDIRGPAVQTRSTNAYFNNLKTGILKIDTATTHGVAFERGFFNNSGKVIFGEKIGDEVIYRYRDEELFTNLDSGQVTGVGTIQGAAFLNQGSILPGFSPGVFNITGDYDHTEAFLEIEIAGTGGPGAVNGHDQIVVENNASLGGTLEITLINQFVPATGDQFVIVECQNNCLGAFDTVNFDLDTAIWELEYNENSVVLNFINAPPVFTSTPIDTAFEDQLYEYIIIASDLNDDILSFSIENLPEWLNLIDNEDGTASLTGTPENDDVGVYEIKIIVEDSFSASDIQQFTLEVINVNDPPLFESTPLLSVQEGVLYQYDILATDPDEEDQLTIEAIQLPVWLTLTDQQDGTALLSGTPQNQDTGFHEVSLRVTDGAGATDEQTFQIEVINANDPPRFTSTPVTEATQGQTYTYLITTEDVDQGDVIQIVAAVNLPDWLTLRDNGDGTAVLSGIPDQQDIGSVSIELIVRDLAGASDEQNFTLRIILSNQPPYFTSLPIETAIVNQNYTYQVTGSDDNPADILSISAQQIPFWLELIPGGNGQASLVGLPPPEEAGNEFIVILRLEDQAGEFVEQEFIITVIENEQFVFQTAITPNGDGLNDTWRIDALADYPDCKVEIFNRWGIKVFSSRGYPQAWDGNSMGNPLPTGTYYFVIDLANGDPPQTGNISILR